MPARAGRGGTGLPGPALPPVAAAAAGAACISSSAVLMRLADTSPSITALGRCAIALPLLGGLAVAERRRGARLLPSRSRWLARLAGLFLAGDLILWSHAISAIGAGLGTVVTNLQVLIISVLAWLFLGERPRRSLMLASPCCSRPRPARPPRRRCWDSCCTTTGWDRPGRRSAGSRYSP